MIQYNVLLPEKVNKIQSLIGTFHFTNPHIYPPSSVSSPDQPAPLEIVVDLVEGDKNSDFLNIGLLGASLQWELGIEVNIRVRGVFDDLGQAEMFNTRAIALEPKNFKKNQLIKSNDGVAFGHCLLKSAEKSFPARSLDALRRAEERFPGLNAQFTTPLPERKKRGYGRPGDPPPAGEPVKKKKRPLAGVPTNCKVEAARGSPNESLRGKPPNGLKH